MLQTTWVQSAKFIKAYDGDTSSVEASEAAKCFKALFAGLRGDGGK